MAPPSLREAADQAEIARSTDRDGTEEMDLRYVLSYADPTGEQAIRNLERLIGWVGPDAKVTIKIQSPQRPDDVLIHLDPDVAGTIIGHLLEVAETPLPQTRSRRAWRGRMKTPAVNVAKQSHREGPAQTPTN